MLSLLRDPRSLGLLALLTLVACGDDDEPAETDAGEDAGDVGGDVATFDPDSAGGDSGSDVLDPPDGSDAGDAGGPDADAATDADAADAEDTPDVITLDCDPRPTCEDDGDCTGGTLCIAGECQPSTTPEEVAFTGDMTLVTTLRLGPPGESVGLDLDGDGEVDNAVGQALINIPRGQEVVERELGKILGQGLYSLVTELVLLPDVCGAEPGTSGAVVYIHEASADLDADGFIDPVPDTGTREVVFLPGNFSLTGGPRCQLRAGSADEEAGTVRASSEGPGCGVILPLPSGEVLQLPVNNLTVEMALPTTASEKDGEPNTVTVAGSVEIQAIVDEANRVAVNCACAGIDTGRPLAETTESGGYVSGACIQSPDSDGCTEQADGQECANLENLCLALTISSGVADFSSGGPDGPIDSLSFGFEALGEPVVPADEPLAPTLLARGDHYSLNENLDVNPGTTQIFAAVVGNDELDEESGDALLSVAFAEGDEAVLELAIEGDMVDVTIPETFDYGETGVQEVSFEYVIGSPDDETRRASATVTMRLANVTPTPEAIADSFEVAAPGSGIVLDVLANDGAAPYGTTYVSAFTQPASGAVSFGEGQRTLLFDPVESGEFTFTYDAQAWSEFGGASGTTQTVVTLLVGCEAGYYGTTCTACADCGVGTCNDGAEGDGVCSCLEGYEGTVEGCFDINECDDSPCDANASCTNEPGTYDCACNEGYDGDGISCSLIGECGTSGRVCGPNSACIPEDNDCLCASGFEENEFSGECEDVDECEFLGVELCGSVESCTNTPGSYECECEAGLFWDPWAQICDEANPCIDGTSLCADDETCLAPVLLGGGDAYDCVPLGSWVEVDAGYTSAFFEFSQPSVAFFDRVAMLLGFTNSESPGAFIARTTSGEGWAFADAEEPALSSGTFSPDGRFLLGASEYQTYAMYEVTAEDVTFVDDFSIEVPFTTYVLGGNPLVTDTHFYLPAFTSEGERSNLPAVFVVEWSPEGFGDWSIVELGMDEDYAYGQASAIDEAGRLYISSTEYNANGAIFELSDDGDGGFDIVVIEPDGAMIQTYFGQAFAVSPDGNSLAVLAPYMTDEPECFDCGTLIIFERELDEWMEIQRIPTNGDWPFDVETAKVALNPPYLMVTFSADMGAFRPMRTSTFLQGRTTGLYLQHDAADPLSPSIDALSSDAPGYHQSRLLDDTFAVANYSGMAIFRWLPVTVSMGER